MQTIKLTGSAGAKAKALEPFTSEHITLHLSSGSFAVGTLTNTGRAKVTIHCEESGDEFFVPYSDIEAVVVRSPGNWNASSGNAASAKTERLQVRCTLEQRVAIERAAGNGRGYLSEFILQAALDRAKTKKPKRSR